MDAITIGSAILSVIGFYAMFVSSKPVTVGSVLMSIVMSMSATQAVVGVLKVAHPVMLDKTMEKPQDVLDGASMAWAWAQKALYAKQEL
jgi:hypothetical protein